MDGTGEPPKINDEGWIELLREAMAGNEEARNRLFSEVRPYLKCHLEWRFDMHTMGANDASDIVQECLMDLHRKAATIKATTVEEFRAWLRAVAEHRFFSTKRYLSQGLRDVHKTVPLPHDAGGEEVLRGDDSSPSQQAIENEEAERRQYAFGQLSKDDQEILGLRYHQGKDWPEIAKIMDRSQAAVKKLFYRAVARWAKAIGVES